jgi:hypothetical protein
VYDVDGALLFADTLPEAVGGVAWDSDASFVTAGDVPSTGALVLSGRGRAGEVLWTSSDAPAAWVGSLGRSSNGDLLVGGGTSTTGFIGRFDASGASKSTTATPTDMFVADLAVHDGRFAVIGVDVSDRVWLGSYADDDTLEWSASLALLDANAVTVTADGTVIAAVRTPSGGSSLLRYNADGTEHDPSITMPWTESLITDVLPLDDGAVVVAASVVESGATHCSLSRINAEGVMTWGVSFAGLVLDGECVNVHLGPDGTLMASGSVFEASGDADAWAFRIGFE